MNAQTPQSLHLCMCSRSAMDPLHTGDCGLNLTELRRALELIGEEVDPEIQLTTLAAFLFVAERGECTQKEVEEGLSINNASASRNVSYWTNRRHDRQPGMGFIERREDDYDRRFRRLTLTEKGRAFADQLRGV